MRLPVSLFLAGASFSLIKAQQNVSAILPHCVVSQLSYLAPDRELLNNSWLTV